ncbi:MAG: hypothetical protein OXI26_11245 [bacterium]|nr:hypothetical protein [bacterium]
MSNAVPTRAPRPAAPSEPGRRQVAVPGAATQKGNVRRGLLLLGVVLVAAAGFAFWFILQQLDAREEYLVTTRTIERWEISRPEDFAVVEAHLGGASGLEPEFLYLVVDRWATGRIPQGTVVNPSMFQPPPLSSDEDSNKVLIQVSLPAGEAPGGSLEAGDKIAMFGAEPTDDELDEPLVGLIGVLELDFVEGDKLTYLVTSAEAKAIQEVVDRYNGAAERRIWKLGFDLSIEELSRLYGSSGAVPVAGDELDDPASDFEDGGTRN